MLERVWRPVGRDGVLDQGSDGRYENALDSIYFEGRTSNIY